MPPIATSTFRLTAGLAAIAVVGAHAYLQAYCFAPGANSMGIIVSNGVDWRIGAL